MDEHNPEPMKVRVYESEKRVMVAAPLPGLQPHDIAITIRDQTVSISGDYRGPLKEDPALLGDDPTTLVVDEWASGPYHREIRLSHPVDGALANATYGNGVLVLVMPKQTSGQRGSTSEFRLEVVEASRGEHVGHVGRDLRPASTEEHRQRVHNAEHRRVWLAG